EVRGLLDEIRPRLAGTALAGQVDYLDALTCLHSGEYDEAERLVRLLRARLRARDELHAKSGWLLGRLQYQQGRPQYALSAFKDVLDSHTSGPYVAASRLGRAECLAELQRYDEAAEAYEAVVGLIRAGRQGRLVDPAVVRGGLTSLYELLQERGRLEEALRFLELAAELVKPEDLEKRTIYLERVARLREALGRRSRQRADQAKDERVRAELLSASKRHFAAAAGTWLRLSKLNTLREAVGARAAWQAAQDFDAAGQIERVIEVLADFVEQRPGNPQAPQAMFRLGQAYQARGQFGKAIAIYQRLLREHPRTLAAFDAYVPLAGCFLALGGRGYRQAERVLLMVLEEDPSSQGVHTPQAFQFREALFRLGALYARRGEHNKAISRLEDFLEYYPQDGRVSRVRFMLAEAYRKSGLGLRGRLEGETDPARREALLGEYPRRLERAAALYGQVIGDYERRGDSSLSRRERLYLELSYLYRADCVFDLGRYEQAIRLYERAAGRYRDQEAALSAYVQIINCCQRLGRLEQVRTAVERLRWLVRRMPDEGFESLPTGMGRRGWQGLLAWMDRSGLLER
ncbi:MAG: tetratricopeptide repeat protein, partial [Phycisphaerae bacterium]